MLIKVKKVSKSESKNRIFLVSAASQVKSLDLTAAQKNYFKAVLKNNKHGISNELGIYTAVVLASDLKDDAAKETLRN